MKVISGGVTAPQGFRANGLYCGIKRSGKFDLSLIASDTPAVAAGVWTKNSIKAAPLVVSQKHLANNRAQAIVTNSGNANCFTGSFGLMYARKTAEVMAKHLALKPQDVIVASTGIIGKPLPFQKIKDAAPKLVGGLTQKGGHRAARGILTTDLKTKEIAVRFRLGPRAVTLGACAKGSGMIEPNMATMLAFITTDACLAPGLLKAALKEAVADTFNMITVDGCMSTNDMVTVMANGKAGNRMIKKQGRDYKTFCAALRFACLDLAKKIVADGEGATKFIEIHVTGARTEPQAKQAGKAIANSVLVKTAAYGSNPNWGRVAAAVGSLGLKGVTEEHLKIHFSPFNKKDIKIAVDLNIGSAQATVYTSDLSHEYVRINGKYN